MINDSEQLASHGVGITQNLLRLHPELAHKLLSCWLPAPHQMDLAGSSYAAISLNRLELILSGIDLTSIHPEVLAHTTSVRQLSFIGGRLCAEQAAAKIGRDGAIIERTPHGVAEWPSGLHGSITHTDGFACAVVVKAESCLGIGIDSEWQVCNDEADSILELCCTPMEKSRWLVQSDSLIATLIFSAKEAGYKAIHGTVRRFVDFTEFETSELYWDDGVLILTPTKSSGLIQTTGSLAVYFWLQATPSRVLVHTQTVLQHEVAHDFQRVRQ